MLAYVPQWQGNCVHALASGLFVVRPARQLVSHVATHAALPQSLLTCCSRSACPAPQPLASNLTSYLILSSTFVADGERGASACYLSGLACTLGLLAQVCRVMSSGWLACWVQNCRRHVSMLALFARCTSWQAGFAVVPAAAEPGLFLPSARLPRHMQAYTLHAVPSTVFWPALLAAAGSAAANSAKLAGRLETPTGAAAWRLWRSFVGCVGWVMLPQVG